MIYQQSRILFDKLVTKTPEIWVTLLGVFSVAISACLSHNTTLDLPYAIFIVLLGIG